MVECILTGHAGSLKACPPALQSCRVLTLGLWLGPQRFPESFWINLRHCSSLWCWAPYLTYTLVFPGRSLGKCEGEKVRGIKNLWGRGDSLWMRKVRGILLLSPLCSLLVLTSQDFGRGSLEGKRKRGFLSLPREHFDLHLFSGLSEKLIQRCVLLFRQQSIMWIQRCVLLFSRNPLFGTNCV